ncbi:MAG: radical SAM protein [Chloroflexi bacterium]|nr:MAG: radical SAM protein [Chloroflexota bacterium]
MRRVKVLLYNPQALFYTMPLALLAVGSALDPARYDVRIVDGRLERDPVRSLLDQDGAEVCLGMSVLSGAPIRDALRVTRAVKARRPDLPVVWGGWHPSLFPAETLHEPGIDVTVHGQGEVTFRELLERLAVAGPLDGLHGTASRVEGDGVLNPPRPLVDVNELPPHNYGLLPVETYFAHKGRRQLDYVSSIGCRFRCAFCADPFVYKRQWMGLSPSRVAAEVADLWRRYRFDELSFQDEAFFTDRQRVVAIADEFLGLGLGFTWKATLRPDQGAHLPDETLALCARSGLRHVVVGVESGAQEILDRITKGVHLEQVVETAARCARHGIGATFSFIVGFPGESDASVHATLNLIKRLRAMSPDFETPIFYYKPYPGSSLAAELVRAGHVLPQTLEAWANFDYIGSSGPWVSAEKQQLVERFQFYSRFAHGRGSWLRWPLQQLARWRCAHDDYRLPLEKALIEKVRPAPRLS